MIQSLYRHLQWSIVLPLSINPSSILHFEWNVGLCGGVIVITWFHEQLAQVTKS
jgi:hypothetical protein